MALLHSTRLYVTLHGSTSLYITLPSLVPTPLSEKSRRGLATLPYNGLSGAVCTVLANQIAEFTYVTLIASWLIYDGAVPFDKALIMSDVAERKNGV